MTAPRSALYELTLVRFRGFFREPSAVFWAFGFPVALSIALGIAFRNRPPEPARVAVQDGPGAASVVERLASPDIVTKVLDEASSRKALRAGKVALVVVPGTPMTYRFDDTRPEGRLARALVDDVIARREAAPGLAPVTEERVSESGARYIDFLVPGLVGMNLMSSGMWGIGYLIVEMRTKKLIKRMLATPMRRSDFLLSFVIMRLVFVFIEVPALFGFAYVAFGVRVVGSVTVLAILSILGALSFAGLGLLVSSRAQNTQTVGGLMNLVMMPMFIGSGVFFSTANFPDAMQPFLRVLPLTALNDALRAVVNEGAGIAQLGPPTAVLVAWGLVSFAVALRIFRWS